VNAGDLLVDPQGRVHCLWDDGLRPILDALGGELVITRASHVEPTADARFTADLAPVGGPVLGPFLAQRAALAAEVDGLTRHNLGLFADVASPAP
jgi:hypothetical protein